MGKDVYKFITTCDSCQRNKPSNQQPAGLLQPLNTSTRRWEQITMDFIVQLPVTRNNLMQLWSLLITSPKRLSSVLLILQSLLLKLQKSSLIMFLGTMDYPRLLFLIGTQNLQVISGKHSLNNWEPNFLCQLLSTHKLMDKLNG